jgi:hypothetical protein
MPKKDESIAPSSRKRANVAKSPVSSKIRLQPVSRKKRRSDTGSPPARIKAKPAGKTASSAKLKPLRGPEIIKFDKAHPQRNSVAAKSPRGGCISNGSLARASSSMNTRGKKAISSAPGHAARNSQINPRSKELRKANNRLTIRTHRTMNHSGEPERRTQRNGSATVFLALSALAAILIAASQMSSDDNSGHYIFQSESISLIAGISSVTVSANKEEGFTVEGKAWSFKKNMEGNKVALMTSYDQAGGGMLWYITPKSFRKITSGAVSYDLSDSGSAIIYIKNYDSNMGSGSAYIYDTAKDETRLLSSNAAKSGFCLSPDGKSASLQESDSTYIALNGQSPILFEDASFCLLSNESAYYFKRKEIEPIPGEEPAHALTLYLKTKEKEQKILDMHSLEGNLYLNTDLSQIVFSADGKTYLIKGGQPQKLLDFSLSSIELPYGLQQTRHSGVDLGFPEGISVIVLGVDKFSDTLINGGSGGYFYINSNYEAEKRPSLAFATSLLLTDDGKSAVFIDKEGNLQKIAIGSESASSKELTTNIKRFLAFDGGREIYAIKQNGELHYVKPSGETSLVSENASDQFGYSKSERELYFIEGRTLFSTKYGGKKTQVNLKGEVNRIEADLRNIYLLSSVNESFSVLRGDGNSGFELLGQYALDILQ